ncbi:MAG: hypothetical protein AUI14_23880 [Actinobacteria bacterium 13_2_20CM_2_71_6]|nr:MAG: hypothetical protein AUI14_23880 [Actinobacteria bacterium 13_2_20CM_2_71_6]
MAAPPARQPLDLVQQLTRAERLLARRVTAILTAARHSLDPWHVITLLADGAGHHMTEIAEHAFLPPATLTKLVDHLVDVNLVYRRVDDLDRRRIRVFLTRRGREVHQRLSSQIAASVAELPAARADQELLVELLGRLVEALDATPARDRYALSAGEPT